MEKERVPLNLKMPKARREFDMKLDSEKYGICDAEIYVDSLSSVDSYILRAYSMDLDRYLETEELDELGEEFSAEVQDYSYRNGSRNHN